MCLMSHILAREGECIIHRLISCKYGRDKAIKMFSALSLLCGVCGKEGKVYKQCSRCTCVYYCSVDCQRKHWKEGGHKDECKKLDF